MECNKEEASRAKELAAIKLQQADYVGAKRIALKAQQLFPGLENISQLLTVCEVHFCAAVKINGETDWYGVLQVETTADDMFIKKQYRKLALLLHPDKNKFTGAEAAFKLIGEAHMILTDQVKRSFHDSKRKSVIASSASLPKKRGQSSKKTDHVANRANKANIDSPERKNKPQQQAGCFAGYSTFWAICLACGTKFQYPYTLLMKVLLCQICSRSFLAYDLSQKPSVRVETSHPCSGFRMQQQMVPPSQQGHVTDQQSNYQRVPGQQNHVTSNQIPVSGFGMQQKTSPPSQQGHATYKQHDYQRVPGQQNPVTGKQTPVTGFGVQQQMFPPSQQAHAINQQHNHQRVPGQQNSVTGHQTPVIHQQQQSWNVSDKQTPAIDQQQHSLKFFNSGSKNIANSQGAGGPNNKGTASSNVTVEAEVCNSTKVARPSFNEVNVEDRPKPPLVNSDKVSLVDKQKRGRDVATGSSYPVALDGSQIAMKVVITAVGAYKISGQNPQRTSLQGKNIGEDGPDSCRGSDQIPDSPAKQRIRKGYASCNAGKSGDATDNGSSNTDSQQKCRIPNTENTPNENGEVINGLDHDEIQETRKEEEMPRSGSDATARSVDNIPCNISVSCPDWDFYDFQKNRDAERFRVDQIWAIYDDHDCMPRYYARIKQVYSPNFMLRFTWLELDPSNDAEKAWSSKELPVACGNFRVGKTHLTEDINMFSHVVSWTKGRKRNIYEIYPRKGEVWALFKGWGMSWCSDSNDHRNYNYDVVEITSDFARGTSTYVTPLEKIKGFVSVFVRSNNEGPFLIADGDTPRFSHNIPFHKLAGTASQRIPNGALELDPASLPSDLEKAFNSVDLDSSSVSTRGGNVSEDVLSTRSSSSGEMAFGKTKLSQDGTATYVQDGVV
ncbi:uncharacterized protein LOC133892795 [Phragmites australis]|uniref:uncharacterized protein LOC133892795 n=1 Tax=Phragmites australis TaxID=29695 RepID=UPI002D774EED|nr:uncharacterized protein LOC133892795 [Phragmites australis]XP_062189729.1 uncharacterized protein LOC133892795 [Phragmites australis]XP_062189731.1 uncharacterized protein LOC133892795 [Phragmites australis]